MSAPPSFPDLTLKVEGAVAEAALARPQARNALSVGLMSQLLDAARFLRDETAVQAVILSGAADYFSAGARRLGSGRTFARPGRGSSRSRSRRSRATASAAQRRSPSRSTSGSPGKAPTSACRRSRSA